MIDLSPPQKQWRVQLMAFRNDNTPFVVDETVTSRSQEIALYIALFRNRIPSDRWVQDSLRITGSTP